MTCTNVEELKKRIKLSGLKTNYIAEKMNISRSSLYSKLIGEVSFNQKDITVISKLLGLNSEDIAYIFFSQEYDKNVI